MNELTIYFPKKLVVGNGTIQKLPGEIIQQGYQKALLITIDPLLNILQPVVEALKNSVEIHLDTSIAQEPSFSDFQLLFIF